MLFTNPRGALCDRVDQLSCPGAEVLRVFRNHDLPAHQPVLPGTEPGTPRAVRQLLYVTGGLTRQATQRQFSSVHEPVTNRPVTA
jgi:hypothetical protein